METAYARPISIVGVTQKHSNYGGFVYLRQEKNSTVTEKVTNVDLEIFVLSSFRVLHFLVKYLQGGEYSGKYFHGTSILKEQSPRSHAG